MEFNEGCLHTFYFHELWWLSESIKKKAEALFEKNPSPEVEGEYLWGVDSDLHYLIYAILHDAANIKKLINTPNAKVKNDKSRKHYKFRLSRAKALSELLEGVDIKEIYNHKIRNTLEHFDEYLDEINVDFDDKDKIPPTFAAFNMVISHWEAFVPPLYPVRLYVSSEKMFYNMKWQVDIGKLHEEASAIIDRLKEEGLFSKDDMPGGVMFPLVSYKE